MSTTYVLSPLVVGVFPAFPVDRFVHGSLDTTVVQAPCIAWLATGSDGSKVLVDTGPPMPTPLTAAFHMALEVRPEHRIDQALRAEGVDPADIQTVIFTHLHYDHCANGELLPDARFLVQREELRHAVLPNKDHRGAYEVGYQGVTPAWMAVFDRMSPVEGTVEVAPGCTMLHLPGHTPGSAGVVFTTSVGRVAVAGDLVNRLENWTGPHGDHAPPALFTDLTACGTSFALLERSADQVLASHDFRSTHPIPERALGDC
jgi:N-acyl homoserine lactone hydrolase